jgi:hypothetical protein
MVEPAPSTIHIRLGIDPWPEHILARIPPVLAKLDAKRLAVATGQVDWPAVENYEWVVVPLVDEPVENEDFRVTATLLPRCHGGLQRLHLVEVEDPELWIAVRRCWRCGAPAQGPEEFAVHLTPEHERGAVSCHAARRVWGDGGEVDLPPNWRASLTSL